MSAAKKEQLRVKISALQTQLSTLQAEESRITAQLHDKNYGETAKRRIALLHEYNEIRDLAHSTSDHTFQVSLFRGSDEVVLLGHIAVMEQSTQSAVMQRFGVTQED